MQQTMASIILSIIAGTTLTVNAAAQPDNLLAKNNPECFKQQLSQFTLGGKATYSKDSLLKDGSGSIKFSGQKKDFMSNLVRTATFKLEKDKVYMLRIYVKMTGNDAGQNVLLKVVNKNKPSIFSEVQFNNHKIGEWEEMVYPYRAPASGEYYFQLFFYKYLLTTDGKYAAKDGSNIRQAPAIYFDNFSVIESPTEEIISSEPYTKKIPFDGDGVRIDAEGNWEIEVAGKWQAIFPRLVYQDWLDDFPAAAKSYHEYGFTGFVNLESMAKLKIALANGMKYNGIQINDLERAKPFIKAVIKAKATGKIPKQSIIVYKVDNEMIYETQYDQKIKIAKWLDKNDPYKPTGRRSIPVYFLNGMDEGLVRIYNRPACNLMDSVGSYIPQSGEGTDFRTNPVNTMQWLDRLHNQTAPVSLMQMQSYYHNAFIPSIFKGIIQGATGLVFWRGGTTHNGSKKDFRENVWAPAIKGPNGVFAKLDKMLPIVRLPLKTNWQATIPQQLHSTVAIGVRGSKQHYIILSNFAPKEQKVKIALHNLKATRVVDYFTQKPIAVVNNNSFTVTVGHSNNGYKVLQLK